MNNQLLKPGKICLPRQWLCLWLQSLKMSQIHVPFQSPSRHSRSIRTRRSTFCGNLPQLTCPRRRLCNQFLVAFHRRHFHDAMQLDCASCPCPFLCRTAVVDRGMKPSDLAFRWEILRLFRHFRQRSMRRDGSVLWLRGFVLSFAHVLLVV